MLSNFNIGSSVINILKTSDGVINNGLNFQLLSFVTKMDIHTLISMDDRFKSLYFLSQK